MGYPDATYPFLNAVTPSLVKRLKVFNVIRDFS